MQTRQYQFQLFSSLTLKRNGLSAKKQVYTMRYFSASSVDTMRKLLKARKNDSDLLQPSLLETEPQPKRDSLVLGLVCYDPSVPSIWKGMMRHFTRCGLDVDYVTFTSYERLVESFLKGHVDIAWNGPLAHARCIRLTNGKVLALGMRDVDRDFKTHIVVRDDAKIRSLSDINGRKVAAGTVDSPQAYIMPFWFLQNGCNGKVDLKSLSVTRYDRDLGKHGDTALGEDSVLTALTSGSAQVGFISDLMWKRYVAANKTKGLRVLESAQVPTFDHCQFTGLASNLRKLKLFSEAILMMKSEGDLAHPENARTMQLEGIRKDWMSAKSGKIDKPEDGYHDMLAALSAWGEQKVLWPGVLHTPARHPFKELVVDYRLVRDNNGC